MYMREVCEFTMMDNSAVISGPKTTVVIDESYFSKRKYTEVGWSLPNQWVLEGIVVRKQRNVF